jgi:NhaA family Na+:H+ antiporter
MAHPPGPPLQNDLLANRLAQPFVRFMELEISSALLLLAMTALALVWANSPWGATYDQFWHIPLGLRLGDFFSLELSLGHWVNDGLMAIFFFVVGMEIKRELVLGELSSLRRATLPVAGAIGGMVVPAGIYFAMHAGQETVRGWGVPMATDIAFAVAALSLLGKRVPSGLRVFLLALAIADDLGAVAVIAVFYTAELHLDALALAGVGCAVCLALNLIGVRSLAVYGVVGAFIWFQTHHSGVHATVAGVMLGFLTPTRADFDQHRETLVDAARHALEELHHTLVGRGDEEPPADPSGHHRHQLVRKLEVVGRHALSPLDFLVNRLERWVAFFIMPVFALANAGVVLEASTLGDPVARKVGLGVALGLVVGKPIGVTLVSWLAVKGGIAVLPRGVTWGSILGAGTLAGIGFTVALFITALAFLEPNHVAGSKAGILLGSLVATVLGLGLLSRVLPKQDTPPVSG